MLQDITELLQIKLESHCKDNYKIRSEYTDINEKTAYSETHIYLSNYISICIYLIYDEKQTTIESSCAITINNEPINEKELGTYNLKENKLYTLINKIFDRFCNTTFKFSELLD